MNLDLSNIPIEFSDEASGEGYARRPGPDRGWGTVRHYILQGMNHPRPRLLDVSRPAAVFADGSALVWFLDGTATRVSAEQLQRLRRLAPELGATVGLKP